MNSDELKNNTGRIKETPLQISKTKQGNPPSENLNDFNLAILNSLSAHIAVIDLNGRIIAVNKAWETFAIENNGVSSLVNCGSNYFHTYLKPSSESPDSDFSYILRGIKDVLSGVDDEFEVIYDCHSPKQKRWFLMRVTPIHQNQTYAVISHTNISEIKRSELMLLEKEKEFISHNILSRLARTSLSFDKVVDTLLQQIELILSPDFALLFLKNGTDLLLKGMVSKHKDETHSVKHQHKVGECLCGISIRNKTSVFSMDIHSDKRCTWQECKEAGIISFAAIPLKTRNDVIGTLGIASKTKFDFHKKKDFLENIASDIALYLENSLLYEKMKSYAGKIELQLQERYKAEEELRKSEEKFRTLVTNNEEIIYMIDKDGIFLLSQGKGLSALGLEPDQVVGESIFELYRDYPEMLASMQKTFNGETVTSEVVVQGLHFRNWYTPQKNMRGEVVGLLGLSVNITSQKKAEQQLLESETDLRRERDIAQNYLDIAGVIILILDTAGSVVLVNKKGCRILGLSEDQITGCNWFETFIPESERENTIHRFNHIISGQTADYKYRENKIITYSGEIRFIAWNMQVLRDDTGSVTGIISSGED